MLDSAADYYRRQQRLTALGVRASRRAASGGPAAVAASVQPYQASAAVLAESAASAMLAEQGIDAAASATLNPSAFVTEGRAVAGMVESAATNLAVDRVVATLVQDAGRSAMSVTSAVRPAVTGHVRYLNPPSCSRCAILAGRVYRWSQGFQRHPLCDCVMVPTSMAAGPGLISDPAVAFERGLIRGLSKADSKAIRDGADMGQVVNIQRKAAGLKEGTSVLMRGGRLTPAGVYRVTKSRDEAVALFARQGYVVERVAPPVTRAALTMTDARRDAPTAPPAAPERAQWQKLTPEEIAARSDGTPLGNKVAAKTKRAYASGNQTVTIETTMTDEVAAALLDDISDVLARAGDQLASRSITFHVPANDRHFSSTKSITGGYVTDGTSTVFLNPRVASGALDDVTTASLMPAFEGVGFRKYTITHELGHVLDHTHTHTRPHVHNHAGRLITSRISDDAKQLAKEVRKDLSTYGKSNVVESYAEAFAQWVLGGPGSSPAADAYARRYGWK